jgi:hypothetical protein
MGWVTVMRKLKAENMKGRTDVEGKSAVIGNYRGRICSE